MNKFRIGLIISAFVIIAGHFVFIDYTDLSWSKNAGSYWGILSMILLIVSMLISIRHAKKKEL
ncbi:hypothetical protein [Carboxylicivirga sp. M1479]|uniref:hypothetical protein n=1 Tax=Carboxylicivirga sp. M1479 TaxID=2594476 RepID=UPI001177EE94|nr:hypothetical protein [Carboxylicivirga sp. M1479]TRX66124.1 hypothetical protein FNN09_15080 [Carboxylicivirga sp. M1479]